MLPVAWPQPLTRLPPLGCSTCPARYEASSLAKTGNRARPPRAGRGGPWDVLAKGGHLLGRHGRRDQRGPDRAGSDGVDPDPLADQLLGQAAGEGNDRALGRGVVDQARVALVGGDRGRVHNRRARTQMGQGRLGQENIAKMLVREVRSSHRLLAEGLVADVAWQGQAAAALGLDQLDRLVGVGGLLGQMPDGHLGAFAGEQHRHRPADAAVPAADQGDLPASLPVPCRRGPGAGSGGISCSIPGCAWPWGGRSRS